MAEEKFKMAADMCSYVDDDRRNLNLEFCLPGVDKEKISLKMLQSVPAFMGADMKEYGPFEQNKTISVPEKIASLLVSRKLAETA